MQDEERKVSQIQHQIHKNNQLPHQAQHFLKKEANSFGAARQRLLLK